MRADPRRWSNYPWRAPPSARQGERAARFEKELEVIVDKAKANGPGVSADQIQPDFERALRVLKSDIDPAIEGMAETRGDVSAAWKIISDECHVNKAAAWFFRTQVLNASDEKSWDVLRSLAGLLENANLRDLFRRAARGTIETRYSFPTRMARLARLYDDLLAR